MLYLVLVQVPINDCTLQNSTCRMQLSKYFISSLTFITVVERSYLQDTTRGNMGEVATPPDPVMAESRSIASLDNNIN